MITLHKPVRRKTRHAHRVLYQCDPRRIVVEIRPGGVDDNHDYLAFSELGRRERYLFPIDVAFRVAVRGRAIADAQARREAKRNK